MTINNMALIQGSIVAECICNSCGNIFRINWKCRDQAVYCPECNQRVLP
jgi:DNA-directed RNA polymerase subunit RPC12/RpoP